MTNTNSNKSRRDFLKASAASVAVLALAPGEVLGACVKNKNSNSSPNHSNDEELVTESNPLHQSKPFSTGVSGKYPYNGKGKITFQKNIQNGVNLLSQDMICLPNTVYVIQYDFILCEDIIIPSDCILEFDGGSIGGNYTIFGTNTVIKAGLTKIFSTDVNLANKWIIAELLPEWFGAKGDFDIFNRTGADDSDAINKTISIAETLNVRKVKFSNVNYLISKGITINTGDIWLDGSGALLNESVGDNNILVSREGGLFCSDNTDLISFATTVKAPIRISNLQFFCYEGVAFPAYNKLVITNKSIALRWKSENPGPVWPFIVEYCHFEGFNKAIYFDSSHSYCVNKVQINNSSFMYNYCCVKFNEKHNNNTWSFTFNNNCAHGNVTILDIKVKNGPCVIDSNNIEGDRLTNAKTEEYVSRVVIDNGSLSFTRNHSEVNCKTILNLCLSGVVKASINYNNTSIQNSEVVNRCDVSYKASGNLFLEECDIPLYIKEYPLFCSRLSLKNPIDFQINAQYFGELMVYTASPYHYTNKEFLHKKYLLYAGDSGYKCRFVNGILTKSRNGKYANFKSKTFAPSSNSDKSSYIMVAFYNPEGFERSENPISLLHSNEGLVVRTDNVGSQYKYGYFIIHRKKYTGNNYFIRENNISQYFGSISATVFYVPKNRDVYTSSLDFGLNHSNIVDSARSLDDSQQEIGDKVFDVSINKEIVWTGNEWVDLVGRKV